VNFEWNFHVACLFDQGGLFSTKVGYFDQGGLFRPTSVISTNVRYSPSLFKSEKAPGSSEKVDLYTRLREVEFPVISEMIRGIQSNLGGG
jgi:hypothetical protein